MGFDALIDHSQLVSSKWDRMEKLYGCPSEDGISMWTAVSDYPTAPCVVEALRREAEHGVFGYTYYDDAYLGSIEWWLKTRHNWQIERDWILSAQGLGNAIMLCIQAFSAPGDAIAYFTPVYHEFHRKIVTNDRVPLELPMVREGERYTLDFDAAAARLTPDTRILLFCAPQNPSGRVWSAAEMAAVAQFAEDHDLILVSDEVHCDLVYAGTTHTPMDVAAPAMRHRTITLNAVSKTFNLAGLKVGNLIIPDPDLRARVKDLQTRLDYMPASLGLRMATAAYSPEGAQWADDQIAYLDENRRIFDAGINAIAGVRSMPLEATYLPWVDFEGTGMDAEEIAERVYRTARVAPAVGATFGTGGEHCMRFNIAAPRARIEEAVARLQAAFSDLQ